ncbi:MAG TPA: TonB-dependent receptor, partial [Calditrichia bacterium]|nr:TonB-dependent receptor [Calditrichia bacterium]
MKPVERLHQSGLRYRLLVLLLWCVWGGIALAGTTGKIAGVITDQSTGEPLPAVNVYIDGMALGAASDIDGYYFILNVPPGEYTLIAQFIGYKELRVEGVKVQVDLTARLNLQMHVETIEGETVTVVADRPIVQKDLTASSTQISSQEIQALPVDNFNEVIELQAGVVDGHFRGGRLGEVSYMIDGLPVNDGFNNAMSVNIENNAIQQLEVISGTFNAEYGQAMSGIVNIVTQEGGTQYQANVSSYASNYYSNNTDIFWGLDEVSGIGAYSTQASLSGPLAGLDKIRFFISGRYQKDDGYLFGRRVYQNTDSDPFFPSGDSALVPMNNRKYQSFFGKVTYMVLPSLKLNYSLNWGDNSTRNYDHGYRLTPDGTVTDYRTNVTHSLNINHVLSKTTYYTLGLSRNETQYQGYLYEDLFDPRYVPSDQGLPSSGYTFRSGGNHNYHYDRTAVFYLAKLDLTSQINKTHKLGFGAQFKQHQVDQFATSFRPPTGSAGLDDQDFVYPEPLTNGWEAYVREPREFAAYVQDKIELDDFIINLGLRFDYFDPNAQTLSDLLNPNYNELFPFGNKQAETNFQLSPRLGVAFPISSTGVIHVSYGHFFQIPNFEQLYQMSADHPDGTVRYPIDQEGLNTVIGNPELDAQRTVTYELGLQQGLTDDIALDFTAYYRDIRNLVGTQIIGTYDANRYARFINLDYGNTRGVVLSFEKRHTDFWGGRIDYTYQIAEGNASDPSIHDSGDQFSL